MSDYLSNSTRKLRKKCRKGLHPWTENNRISRGDRECCLACFRARMERENAKRRKTDWERETGWCRKGLHRLEGDNAGWRTQRSRKPGARYVYCRKCGRVAARERRRSGLAVRVYCPGTDCKRNTLRSPVTNSPYICREHRREPTPGVLAVLRVYGVSPREAGVADHTQAA